MLRYIVTTLLFLFYAVIIFCSGVFLGKSEVLDGIIDDFYILVRSSLSMESNRSIDDEITVWTDDKSKKHDGLILINSQFINNPAIILVNSDGKILHRWNVEKKIYNPDVIKLHKDYRKDIKDTVNGIEDSILLPNGDIIFSQSLYELDNFRAQRIARMDKNSNIIWEIPGLFHHDMILAEDGNIYSVGSELRKSIPHLNRVKDSNKVSFITGVIKVTSTDGKIVKKISLEDAFQNSGFENMLTTFDVSISPQKITLRDGSVAYDLIHLNSVDYITAKQAELLPFAQAGDLLVSMRGISAIAILRPSINKIIWAMKGPWKSQHFVRMTDKGTITIYDNEGESYIAEDKKGRVSVKHQSRVLEFNPNTLKTKILFDNKSNENMYSYWRGYYKFIDNGSSMIVSSSDNGRVLQVDKNSNIIWELRTVKDRQKDDIIYTKKITSVKYYEKNYAKFLDCPSCSAN